MLFGRSKQAYYKRNEESVMRRLAREEFIVQYVRNIREYDHGIGGVKAWHMYIRDLPSDALVGRDTFLTVLSENGLLLRKKPRHPRTTDSTHGLPLYPDLVRDFIPSSRDQLWVSDITYIEYRKNGQDQAFCYLSMILDGYTEEIIGWSVGPTLETCYPVEALKMALRRISGRNVDLIHHSDRGCQYSSKEYTGLLSERGIRISMTETGDPKHNAQAERINNTMKNELLLGMRFCSIEEVRAAVSKAVAFYNLERPHMSLDMMTPAQVASCSGELKKRWRSYRLEAIRNAQKNSDIPENGLPLQHNITTQCGQSPTFNQIQEYGNSFQE